ncbi:MAG: hypothetical protein Q9165_002927 [Trypethelium subeluteriae]
MKSSRALGSLLLLLLLAVAPSIAREKAFDAELLHAVAPETRDYPTIDTGKSSSLSGTKSSTSTKDAPVDGLDGKPHDGPFVETSPEENRKKAASDSLASTYDSTDESGSSSPSSSDKMSGKSKGSVDSSTEENGVMSDRAGRSPATGHKGTEGGISEKDRDRKTQEGHGVSKGKTPDSPKEQIDLPDSIQDRIELKEKTEKNSASQKVSSDDDKPWSAPGLEKPDDLPEKPHDIPAPIPVPPSLPKLGSSSDSSSTSRKTENSLERPTPHTSPSSDEEDDGIIQPFHSFILSLTMILFSEVGDKTFLVAALMAMRHPRLIVFSAAFSALFVMTVLSAVLGHALPTLLPKRFTSFAAAILFLVFGAKMLREGLAMDKDEGVGEEMKEVEMELEEKEHQAKLQGRRRTSNISPYALEAGRGRKSRSEGRLPAPPRSPSSSRSPSPSLNRSSIQRLLAGLHNLFSLLLSPAWVQTFVMTFLGEWGDRSQIATIAMAAGQDYWWVTGGAITGHGFCTAVAVVGGAAIAGRVSMRVGEYPVAIVILKKLLTFTLPQVTLGGAFAFLAFGIIYLLEAAYSDWNS